MRIVASFIALSCTLASSAFAQCGAQWLSGLQTPDLNAVPISAVEWDPDGSGPRESVVVFSGPFTKAASISVNGVVAWDGQRWFKLEGSGPSLNMQTAKLLAIGNDLYALRDSTVFRWSGTEWLADLSIQSVNRIAGFQGDLIAFGNFFINAAAHKVARKHDGQWIAIDPPSSSSDQTYNDTIEYGGKLYCSGRFQFAGSPFAPWMSFITFDGTTWDDGGALPLASSSAAERLCIASGTLYSTYNGKLYRREANSWIALPVSPGSNPAMASGPRESLYLAPQSVSGPAIEWNGSVSKDAGFPWLSLFGGAKPNLLVSSRFGLIAIGSFATRVSIYDGSSWGPLAETFGGMINAFGHFNGHLLAGHGFKGATSSSFLSAYARIAQWNGLRFETVGSLPNNVDVPSFPPTAAIHSFTNDGADLLAAGAFRLFDGAPAGGTLTLSPTGQLQSNGPLLEYSDATYSVAVYALIRFRGQLHAIGCFASSAGNPLANIARLTANGWEWPDAGLPISSSGGAATAAIVFGDELIVSGAFDSAGDVAASNVARWDGEHWHAMGDPPASFRAFAIYNGDLYGAGRFTVDTHTCYLAKWTGSDWQFLPGPLDGSGYALLIYQGNLIVGGETNSGAIILHKWDGSALSEFVAGQKPSGKVYALAEDHGELVVGGDITLTSTTPSNFFARWSPDGIPWIAQQPRPAAANCSRDLAFSAAPALGYTKYTKYQWRRNGVNLANGVSPSGSIIAGAQTLDLQITRVSPSDAGDYDCLISSTSPVCPPVATDAAHADVLCCPSDLSGDLLVDDTDFQMFIIAYNILECPPVCPADFNHDNYVDDADFQIFVLAYNALICE